MTEQQAHAQDGDEIIEKAIAIVDATRAKFKPGSWGHYHAAHVASQLRGEMVNRKQPSTDEMAAEFRDASARIVALLDGLPKDSRAYAAIFSAAAAMVEHANWFTHRCVG